jgi:photolyase PhrII
MPSPSAQRTDVRVLPANLAERVRVIRNEPHGSGGEFVLYWMHHAVRSHENPALDTASFIAAKLGLPVLVYQGLGGRHPFNSDRHHTFIMEGAREVQQQLRERRIAHVFYLGRRPEEPTPLKSLARRAALVITEDFPAPPFPQWTRQLARQVPTAVWAVDCACIIPMQLIERPFARAFSFRNHTQKDCERRLMSAWEEVEPPVRCFEGDCGFESIDLATEDIAELCATCDIDHTIPPVAHTPGGSSSGYARWQQFKRHGLKSYAHLRNDAAVLFPQGVSRLSAYLHHGHISPLRIAREAAREGTPGAAKFLDELLVWRELAHNFCYYHRHPQSLDVLPRWARQSLLEHLDDPREEVYSWERLYRGKTGDPLWDAAQRSLLVHGELHNNVRMTWGKALVNWAWHPQDALDLMIDLNHRLALDGNDPNSYGGLLWCLGLFDRPFKPERPVIGKLRPRSTEDHRKRLDMKAYVAKVKGPVLGGPLKVAVVGAGVSGLFAARTLIDHGHQVQVFEKADRPGGRTASLFVSTYAFDTGAQYFTVRDDRLRRYLQSWCMDGIVQRWKPKVVVIEDGRLSIERRAIDRWVGVPAMDSIASHLAAGLDIRFNTSANSLVQNKRRWQLFDQDGTGYGPFDAVALAIPPPQAGKLAECSPRLVQAIAGIDMRPCLAVMAAFDKPLEVAFDAAFVQAPPFRWVARNNSKPRRSRAECWVFHTDAQFSANNTAPDIDSKVRPLLAAFFNRMGHPGVDPVYLGTRYWRFAAAANPLKAGCLWDREVGLGLCGDWCRMSRLEGAALSGMAMAGRILGLNAGAPLDSNAPDARPRQLFF